MNTTIVGRMKRAQDEALLNRVKHAILETGKTADYVAVTAKILFQQDDSTPVTDEEILTAVQALP